MSSRIGRLDLAMSISETLNDTTDWYHRIWTYMDLSSYMDVYG